MDTYGELKTAISSWIDRTDNSDDQVEQWVRLTESEIYGKLRSRDNHFKAQYTAAGVTINGASVGGVVTGVEYKSLPSNFRQLNLVTWNGKPLIEVSEQKLLQRRDEHKDREVCYYSQGSQLAESGSQDLVGGRSLEFSASLGLMTDWDPEDRLEVHYYGTESLTGETPLWNDPARPTGTDGTVPAVTPASNSNTTRLFRAYPQLYLYGCLTHAHRYHREDTRAEYWNGQFRMALAQMRQEAKDAEFSGSTSSVNNVYGSFA